MANGRKTPTNQPIISTAVPGAPRRPTRRRNANDPFETPPPTPTRARRVTPIRVNNAEFMRFLNNLFRNITPEPKTPTAKTPNRPKKNNKNK